MKLLVTKLLALTTIVVVVLLVMDWGYRRLYQLPYVTPGPLLTNSPLAEPYQIVNLGNSHAQSAVTFKGYRVASLDLSGVAQPFVYDLALLKQHHQEIAPGAVILIAVTPISFSHSMAENHTVLQSNYYGRLSPWLIPNLNVSEYLQTQIFPFWRSAYLWRQKYHDLVQQQVASQEKAPELVQADAAAATQSALLALAAQPGGNDFLKVTAIQHQLAAPTLTKPVGQVDNMNFVYHKWLETDEFDPNYFASNRQALEALLAYSYQHHWRPVLITIPVAQTLLDGLPADYLQAYLYDNLEKTDLQNTEYFDFSQDQRLTQNNYLFANVDHLNCQGALVFSYLVLQNLIEQGYLSSAADGYDYEPLVGSQ